MPVHAIEHKRSTSFWRNGALESVEDSPGWGDMTVRAISQRRFPDVITRRRTLPGAYNEYGKFIAGAIRETELRASVQPLSIEDKDFAGGAQERERVKVYVPSGPVEQLIESDTLTWGGEQLDWASAPLSWGRIVQNESPGVALQAAFEDSQADRVAVAGVEYVVEESRYWPRSHTRAILLRET